MVIRKDVRCAYCGFAEKIDVDDSVNDDLHFCSAKCEREWERDDEDDAANACESATARSLGY